MLRAVSHKSASYNFMRFYLTLKSLVHIYRRKKSTWKISSVSTVHNVWPIHQAALSSLYLHVRRVNRDTHNGAI